MGSQFNYILMDNEAGLPLKSVSADGLQILIWKKKSLYRPSILQPA